MSRPHVAIVGATGAVGHEFLRVLDERAFEMASLKLLASERSAGKLIDFRGDSLVVEQVSVEALRGVDIAFFSAGGGTSQAFARAAVDVGCVVIDNSSAFRLLDDVPLVVPEVNVDALSGHQGIIANPNCSTAQ
ncbi:MAG: aspartate-semialdehyde dehydrogenase, partial [Planctomycetes bacterium]|nr:aspartate-semialdehyde dehydrogenase [Planctomycetota bacterium]